MGFVKEKIQIITSKIEETYETLKDKVMESSIAHQIEARWEEIEPKNRVYYKWGAGAFGAIALISIASDLVSSSYALKEELQAKKAAIELIQKAIDEERSIPRAQANSEDLLPYVSNLASSSGIDPSGVQLGAKVPSNSAAKNRTETVHELSIQRTGLRQLVQYVVSLESNLSRPMKVRSVSIQKVDPTETSVQAKLELSHFEVK